MGLVDEAWPVGLLPLPELLGAVLILVATIGNKVRPLMWQRRQTLQHV